MATVMVVRMMLVRMFWAGTSTVPEDDDDDDDDDDGGG